MPGISITDQYDALLTTTLKNYRRKMVDQIFEMMNFLNWLRKGDRVRKVDGGESIIEHLMYGKNDTVKFYSGYENLLTTPQEGMTVAKYDWKEIGGTISISRKEQRQNSGKARLLNLLEQKTKQTEMSVRDEVSSKIFADIASEPSKDITGLFLHANDNPSSTTVGGINGSTYAWWRNGADDVGAYATNLLDKLRTAFNTVAKAGQGPADFVVCTQTAHEYYEALGDTLKRFPLIRSEKQTIELGFEIFKYKGADLFWDPDMLTGVPATGETMVLGKSSALSLVIDKQSDFITTDFIEPENQTAKVAKVVAMLNLTNNNRRCLHLLHGIDAS